MTDLTRRHYIQEEEMQETEMYMRRRFVSLYVEWTEEADTDAIRALLHQYGARMIGIDEETDRKKSAGLLFRHDNTVFRFYTDWQTPVHELLSAVAMHPGVYSVSEL